jgi:hypothetical protein
VTTYPFPIPAPLMQRLPLPARDRNHYLDVRVRGRWDGVIAVDGSGMCIGVYICRRIEKFPLPFTANDIEDIRKATLSNRILASFPFNIWNCEILTVVAFSPVTLVLAWMISPLFALISVFACSVAIYILYLAPGWPFIRLPVAMFGLGQIVSGGLCLLRSLW